jgi:hypothetical protein
MLSGLAPTAAVLLMVALIAGLAVAGDLPGAANGASADMRRDALLSYLPDVDRVSYARNVLYLYVHGVPLMVVWVADDPAKLFDADGHFVAPLDIQEFSRVIRRASAVMTRDPRRANSPDDLRDQA